MANFIVLPTPHLERGNLSHNFAQRAPQDSNGATTSSPTASSTSRDFDWGQTTAIPQPNGPPGTPSASLYLFVFLATLLVLLGLSVGILMRSCILRRRFRQRFEEALAAGAVFGPRTSIGGPPGGWARWPKPVLHDVFLARGGDHDEKEAEPLLSDTAQRWDKVQPLAASFVSPKDSHSSSTHPSMASLPSTPGPSSTNLVQTRFGWLAFDPGSSSAQQIYLPSTYASQVNNDHFGMDPSSTRGPFGQFWRPSPARTPREDRRDLSPTPSPGNDQLSSMDIMTSGRPVQTQVAVVVAMPGRGPQQELVLGVTREAVEGRSDAAATPDLRLG